MKRIVILGAGFGGLRAAFLISRNLKRLKLEDRYSITIVDRNDHQTYTPLLYEVATTSKETANLADLHSIATYDISFLLRAYPIEFIQTEVIAIDLLAGAVRLGSGKEIRADYLIIALGSEPNFFDIPGLEEYALPFKTMKDAIVIRDMIWNSAMEGATNIRIVIGGGGPSGVELAGELKAWCGELDQEFKKCNLDVTLIEAEATIMPGFTSRVVKLAKRRLLKLGVRIVEQQKILAVQKHLAQLENRSLPFDVLVWTGGVKAPAVLSRTPLKTEGRGRVEVHGRMECLPQTPDLKLHGKIYGLGDSICFYNPKTNKPIPGVARAALIQAKFVAHNIVQDIAREEGMPHTRRRIYKPSNYPYVTPIGGKYAIAKIGPLVFSGFLAWIFKGLVELNYLLSIMSVSRALSTWFKGFVIFAENDRLG